MWSELRSIPPHATSYLGSCWASVKRSYHWSHSRFQVRLTDYRILLKDQSTNSMSESMSALALSHHYSKFLYRNVKGVITNHQDKQISQRVLRPKSNFLRCLCLVHNILVSVIPRFWFLGQWLKAAYQLLLQVVQGLTCLQSKGEQICVQLSVGWVGWAEQAVHHSCSSQALSVIRWMSFTVVEH